MLADIDPDLYWGPSMSVMAAVSHTLIILNSSTNFIIYCYKVYIYVCLSFWPSLLISCLLVCLWKIVKKL